MGPPIRVGGALCLLLFVGGSFAGPILTKNSLKCENGPPLHKTTKYAYTGISRIQNDDVDQEVNFSADVLVQVPRPCVIQIKLLNVQSPHQKFTESLEKSFIEVYMDNGQIMEFYQDSTDKVWSVNVKRAIASMLQSSLKKRGEKVETSEKDVLGICDTSYEVDTEKTPVANVVHIKKTKSLLSCQHRFQAPRAIFATPYEAPRSDIRTPPMADGTFRCEQSFRLSDGVATEVVCRQKEKLYFSQQSTTQPGAISSITSTATLKLVSEDVSELSLTSATIKKGCVVFDASYVREQTGESLVLTVNRFCDAMRSDVRPETGKLFGDLLKSMRGASFDKINGVYEMIDSKSCDTKKLRAVFLDVLGMAGSSGSMKMIGHLISSNKEKHHHAQWLSAMSYITEPTEEMINAMVPIVRHVNKENAKHVLLPVSAMANTFCKLHGADCNKVPAIEHLIHALNGHLGDGCNKDRAVVVATLKAFGNLGQMFDDHSVVLSCLNKEETDLRLYTLRAFRKVCDAKVTRQMLAIYSNQDEDVEIRIAAYLNVIKCADFDSLTKVIEVYENEKIHQVGSFVYSHLRNLHDTNCPLKESLKQLIASMPISAKFSNDPSKFSQNFEYSKFYDSVNVGGMAEGSVVFTPKSFLPRSASLNLTVDVFSNAFNLLEIGGRVEGLEKYLQQMMGSNSNLGDKIRDQFNRLKKRSTAQDTDVAQFDSEHTNSVDVNNKMAFYVIVHGNEIEYVEYNSLEQFTNDIIVLVLNMMKMHPSNLLSSVVSQTEIDIAKNVVLVDNSVTVSTLTGVGLAVELRAISNVVLKASIPTPSGPSQLKGSIEPSAVVQIDGSLTLDAGAFRHGARMASTIHTSSVIDIQISDVNGEFKFLFSTPRDKIEVLNAKSEIFKLHGGYETPVTAKITRDLHGCTQRLPQVLGVAVCLSGTVPKPWYLAGRGFVKPFNFALTLEKFDKNMQGFEFVYRRNHQSIGFSFDTPGVEGRRRAITFEKVSGGFRVSGECPAKSFDGKITNIGSELVDVQITDKKTGKITVYAFSVDMDIQQYVFKATCPYLDTPAVLTIAGDGEKYTIKSNYPKKNPLDAELIIGRDDGILTLAVGDLKANTKISNPSKDSRTWHSIWHTEYTIADQEKQTIHHELKVKTDFTGNDYHWSGLYDWSMTCHPQYNHKINFDAQAVGDNRKHKIQIWWDKNFDDESKTLRINIDAKKKGEFGIGNTTTMQLYVQVFSPVWGLNWDGKYNSKIDLQRSARITSELFVTRNKETLVNFEFLFDRNAPKTAVRLNLVAPHTRFVVSDDSQEISKGKYEGITQIEWGVEGKKLSVEYTCELLQNGNHDLKLNIRAPNMKTIRHRHLIRVARDVTLQTQTLIDGKEYIVFEIKKDDNSVAFNFIGQKIQINYQRTVKDKAVDMKLDVQSKIIYTRPISLVVHKDSPGKKTHMLNIELKWDAVANPDRKLSVVMNTDREDGVKSDVKIDITNIVNFHYKGVYVKGFIKGPNRAEFQLSGPKIEARELIIGHTHSQPKGEGYMKYTRGGKVLVDAKGGHEFTESKRDYFLTVTGVMNRKLTISRDLANRALKIELDRDGKIYNLHVETKSDWSAGVIDSKATLLLPYEGMKSQTLTTKGSIADGKVDVTIHYLSGTNKNYNLVIKGTRPGKMQLDVTIDITSDHEKLKKATAVLKYKLDDPTNREIYMKVDAEDKVMLHMEAKSVGADYFNREMNIKFKSNWTPSYEYTSKIEGNKDKFISKSSTTKDGAPYATSEVSVERSDSKMSFNMKTEGGFFGGNNDIQFERNVLPGDNHRSYKLNIKRNDRELKADAETNREAGNKVTTLNICRTPVDSDCVSFTVKRNINDFHLFRNNAINVKIHRKPDVTVVIDGQIHIPADVHKAHLRLVGNINEFKLGGEYHCDHSTEQVSEQKLIGYVVDREMLATRRREQTDKFIDIKYTASLDSKSDERLEATYRRDMNDKGYTSLAKLSHPKMRNPIVLKSELSHGKDANSIIRLESELEWAKPEDKIFFHFERRMNDDTPRNRSLHIHIHKQDKTDYDLSVTLYRSEDLKKPVFVGYLWSYITAKKESRVGSLKAYLGEDLKGYIDFTSPYQDSFKITGEAKVINDQGDKEAEVVHLKNGVETKGKISYNMEKMYMKAQVLDSAGAQLRELEVDGGRKEKGHYKLLLSSFPEGKKTTDIGIEHAHTSATAFHSKVYMPPDYIQRVAERVKDIAASRVGKYPIEEFKEEVKARFDSFSFKLRKVFEDIPEYLLGKVSQIFVEIQQSLTRLINNTTVGQALKKKIEQNREKIEAILKRILAIIREISPKTADRIEELIQKFAPKRARRSVEEEERSLIVYVTERLEMFKDWLMELPPVQFVTGVYQKIVDGYESFKKTMCSWARSLKASFLELPDVKQIAKTWAELYDSSSVGYVMPREAVMNYIIKPRIQGWMARAPVIEIDTKTGRFVADVDVPVDASDIIQYWAYGTQPRKQQKQRKFDLAASNPLDMIVNAFSESYDGFATVIDGKHFITFDGKHYSADNDCSYLLARDFVNGSFSVILNGAYSQSYTIQVGKNYVQIVDDIISVNGKPNYQGRYFPDLVISQTDEKIQVSSSQMSFTLYTRRNIATVALRVWYFGKTDGLLGNYNREPSDDMRTPSGEEVSNEKEFLEVWQTNECSSYVSPLQSRSEDTDAVEFCENVFRSDKSTLALGFPIRNPDRYLDLCLRAAYAEARPLNSICRVAQAYLLDIERFADLPGYLGARLPNECRK